MSTRWRLEMHAEEGVSAVEYGVLAAGVGIVLLAAGPALVDAFLDLVQLITGGFSR